MGLLRRFMRLVRTSTVRGREEVLDSTLTGQGQETNTVSSVTENLYESIRSCNLTSDCFDTIDRIGLSPRRPPRERRTDLGHTAGEHSFIGFTAYHEHSLTRSSLTSSCSDLSTINNTYESIDTDSDDVDVTPTPPITSEISEELKKAIHSTVGRMLGFTDTDTSSVMSDVTMVNESFSSEIEHRIFSSSSSQSIRSDHTYEDIDCPITEPHRSHLKITRQTGMVDVRKAMRNETTFPLPVLQQTTNNKFSLSNRYINGERLQEDMPRTYQNDLASSLSNGLRDRARNENISDSSVMKRRKQMKRRLEKSDDVILAILGDC